MRSPSATTTSWPRRWPCSSAAEELILLTDIDGLFTADPRLHPDARIVSEVSDFAALEDLEIGHTTSPLGSGGMRSKVVAADMATAAGISTVICNGLRTGALAAVLAGEREGGSGRTGGGWRAVGTYFPAREARYSSFKLWLKYAKPSRGTLLIDAGAVRAVREGSASLLPVGVVGGARRLRRGRRRGDRRVDWRRTRSGARRWARGSATTRHMSCGRCSA